MRVLLFRSLITSTGRAETSKFVKTAMPAVLSAWAAVLVAVVVGLVAVDSVATAAVAASVAEAASAEVTVDEEGTAEVDPQVEAASMPAVLPLLPPPHLTRSLITLSPVQRRASSSMSET